jgi:NifU-like protein
MSIWMQFSRKLADRIENPRFVGSFTQDEATQRNVRLAVGEATSKEGFKVKIFLLVDEWDGVIVDARFRAFGPPALLGIADGFCDLLMRKNYDQAQKIGADLVDKQLSDKKEKQAVPKEEYRSINLVLDAVEEATKLCSDIPLSEAYVPTPMQPSLEGGPYPGWDELSLKQQLSVIEDLIAVDIRPYIELDAGGIEIVSLTDGRELVIAYKGACTTCPSSVGSTLQAIQQILSARIHPDIRVVPDSSFLSGGHTH